MNCHILLDSKVTRLFDAIRSSGLKRVYLGEVYLIERLHKLLESGTEED